MKHNHLQFIQSKNNRTEELCDFLSLGLNAISSVSIFASIRGIWFAVCKLHAIIFIHDDLVTTAFFKQFWTPKVQRANIWVLIDNNQEWQKMRQFLNAKKVGIIAIEQTNQKATSHIYLHLPEEHYWSTLYYQNLLRTHFLYNQNSSDKTKRKNCSNNKSDTNVIILSTNEILRRNH